MVVWYLQTGEKREKKMEQNKGGERKEAMEGGSESQCETPVPDRQT